MQPYYIPYIGYFQLIAAVDIFIIYDNVKYTKKGWINRNRILLNGRDSVVSLPLKSGSDSFNVVQRELASNVDFDKLLNIFRGAYSRAPYFADTILLLKEIFSYNDKNLFNFLYNSIVSVCAHLGISTEIKISSDFAIDHGLKGADKVVELCRYVGADVYVNPIGGVELYDYDFFRLHELDLRFLRSRPFEYSQFGEAFVPWLSIIDVLMFNPVDVVRACVTSNYELV